MLQIGKKLFHYFSFSCDFMIVGHVQQESFVVEKYYGWFRSENFYIPHSFVDVTENRI